jgi:aminoglycoside phosphotransferase (APT) family kinase protein
MAMGPETAERIVGSTDLLKAVTRIEFLERAGYSDQQKFVLWEADRPTYLLRLSGAEVALQREKNFRLLHMLAEAGIRCPVPYLFGVTEDGSTCYAVMSFIAGRSAEDELPAMTGQQQYEVGIDAGRELRKLHAFSHPDQGAGYAMRRTRKYERYRQAMHDLGLSYAQQDRVQDYVETRLSLLGKYPVGLQHDDYHAGNLIVQDGRFAGVIDCNGFDWGDPLEDFYKVPWFSASVSLPFARGQIDGYQEAGAVEDFWRRYNLFVAMSFDSSLVWIHTYYPAELESWRQRIEELLRTHDFKEDGPPLWYHPTHA